eukprot:6753891-Alexandrium_andersonii.AAC.1
MAVTCTMTLFHIVSQSMAFSASWLVVPCEARVCSIMVARSVRSFSTPAVTAVSIFRPEKAGGGCPASEPLRDA